MKIVLIGGGKFAGLIYSSFSDKYDFAGYVDDVYAKAYVEEHYQLKKIGTSQDMEKVLSICENCVIAIGSVEDTSGRWEYCQRYLNSGFNFPTLIHSSASVANNASIDNGTIVRDNSIIHPMVKIGKNCVVSTNVLVGHDSVIGDNVFIAPGAIVSGSVVIGDSTFVGAGAIVIQKRKIGKKCVVGAGACVVEDAPDDTKLVGIPARPIS